MKREKKNFPVGTLQRPWVLYREKINVNTPSLQRLTFLCRELGIKY